MRWPKDRLRVTQGERIIHKQFQIGIVLALLAILSLQPRISLSSTNLAATRIATVSQIAPGTTRVDSFNVTQVYVPAGCFQMGSTDKQAAAAFAQAKRDSKDLGQQPSMKWFKAEEPPHKVCLTQSFWLDQSEVTNKAYDAFVKSGGYTQQNLWSVDGWKWLQSQEIEERETGCTEPSSDPQEPRDCITYYEAEAYAKWRSGGLPTEAQWEYAARGPDSLIYPWGNDWDQAKVNTRASDIGMATPVCSYPSGNSWVGACDMAGNVFELVRDWASDKHYSQRIKDDPTGPASGDARIVRGGSWFDVPSSARSASRGLIAPYYSDFFTGFRIMSIVSVTPSK